MEELLRMKKFSLRMRRSDDVVKQEAEEEGEGGRGKTRLDETMTPKNE
jgi:hypothetical protein